MIRPLRNPLDWGHINLISRKAAPLELILPGWKNQVFQIVNKIFYFFLVNLRPIFYVFIAKFHFQQVADVEA